MTARVLIESGSEIEMLSLLDNTPVAIGASAAAGARGSKLAFVIRCHLAAPKREYFIYDSAGIARAHPRLGPLARPYAVWMHGIEVWHGLSETARKALERADLRVVNSHFTINRHRELHSANVKAQVCWLATEEDHSPERLADFSGAPCVMILARIDNTEAYKGHAELVKAWPRVVSAIPAARLVIAGGGPGLEQMRNLVAASPAAANIEVTGFVAEKELPGLWQRIHLLAMPSRNEGFGLVYVEAMRHGVPVIASVHDAGREVNLHGITGFNVNLYREGELAECIVSLLRDPDLMWNMGRAGHERWREYFRYSAFRRRLVPILEEFTGARL